MTKQTIGLEQKKDGLYLLDSSLSIATPTIKKGISTSESDELFT